MAGERRTLGSDLDPLLRTFLRSAGSASPASRSEEFRTFVVAYDRPLRAYIARWSGDREMNGDLAQRSWERLWAVLHDEIRRTPAVLGPGLLFTIAGSEISNNRRAAARRRKLELKAMNVADRGELNEQDDPMLPDGFSRALMRLPERDLLILQLRFAFGASSREVAAAFGTSEVAARRRVSRAVERLRALCHAEGDFE